MCSSLFRDSVWAVVNSGNAKAVNHDHTVIVEDIYPGSTSSYPEALTAIGNTLFFSADNRHERT